MTGPGHLSTENAVNTELWAPSPNPETLKCVLLPLVSDLNERLVAMSEGADPPAHPDYPVHIDADPDAYPQLAALFSRVLSEPARWLTHPACLMALLTETFGRRGPGRGRLKADARSLAQLLICAAPDMSTELRNQFQFVVVKSAPEPIRFWSKDGPLALEPGVHQLSDLVADRVGFDLEGLQSPDFDAEGALLGGHGCEPHRDLRQNVFRVMRHLGLGAPALWRWICQNTRIVTPHCVDGIRDLLACPAGGAVWSDLPGVGFLEPAASPHAIAMAMVCSSARNVAFWSKRAEPWLVDGQTGIPDSALIQDLEQAWVLALLCRAIPLIANSGLERDGSQSFSTLRDQVRSRLIFLGGHAGRLTEAGRTLLSQIAVFSADPATGAS